MRPVEISEVTHAHTQLDTAEGRAQEPPQEGNHGRTRADRGARTHAMCRRCAAPGGQECFSNAFPSKITATWPYVLYEN